MLHLITQTLVKINDSSEPVRHASGVIVKYNNHNFLLTVAHATNDFGNWAIQTRYVRGKGSELYQLGGMSFAKVYTLKRGQTKERDIDFSYKLLVDDVQARYQELTPEKSITADEPKITIETELSATPNIGGEYAFWGLTRQQYDETSTHLYIVPTCVGPMHYVKVNEHSNLYQFRLQQEDQQKGIAEYENCSGAPIFDREGNLVSLVVETDSRTRYIYGIRLEQMRPLLDAEIDMHNRK